MLAHLLPTDADLLVDEVVCRLSRVNGSLKLMVILSLKKNASFLGLRLVAIIFLSGSSAMILAYAFT
jgi:hypothetical protein